MKHASFEIHEFVMSHRGFHGSTTRCIFQQFDSIAGYGASEMRTFGAAWAMMGVAFGLHVLDEASTDFLAWYNPIAQRIRSHLGGLPFPPVFTFLPWLLGLLVVTAIQLGLTPFAYAQVAGWSLSPSRFP